MDAGHAGPPGNVEVDALAKQGTPKLFTGSEPVFGITKKNPGILCTIDHLELHMPRYARRGGDVILKCNHSVHPEQLYKVEWRKGEKKFFQYIKGRKPPFRYFKVADITLNDTNSNEKQVQLSKLNFSASGSYSCTVSTDAPIFTKDSDSKDLTIFEPQEDDPRITFNKETYEMGDILRANCTTSSSRPPPHITWLINDQKVTDQQTKSFSNGLAFGHGYFDQKGYSIKQLFIEVSDLHIGDDNTIKLTCVATIPGYITSMDNYADIRTSTAQIDVELTEGPVEAISNNNMLPSLSSSWHFSVVTFLLCTSAVMLFYV